MVFPDSGMLIMVRNGVSLSVEPLLLVMTVLVAMPLVVLVVFSLLHINPTSSFDIVGTAGIELNCYPRRSGQVGADVNTHVWRTGQSRRGRKAGRRRKTGLGLCGPESEGDCSDCQQGDNRSFVHFCSLFNRWIFSSRKGLDRSRFRLNSAFNRLSDFCASRCHYRFPISGKYLRKALGPFLPSLLCIYFRFNCSGHRKRKSRG
jgi:hypothetical protein